MQGLPDHGRPLDRATAREIGDQRRVHVAGHARHAEQAGQGLAARDANESSQSRLASLEQLAGQLGFADEAYFGRFFRKHTGLSPREFRARALQALIKPEGGVPAAQAPLR